MRAAASLALLAWAAQLAGCGCGFGGPGCGEPGIQGLCSGLLPPSTAVSATVVYQNDTGWFPAKIDRVSSSDASVLEVTTTVSKGLLVLESRSAGVAAVSLEVAGWARARRFDFEVQDGASEPGAECVDEILLPSGSGS